MNNAELRKLRSLVRTLHGEDYTRSLIAKMDDRGLGDVRLERFADMDAIEKIGDFPIHWLEIEVQKSSQAKEVPKALAVLLSKQQAHLEFLMVSNILDLSSSKKKTDLDVFESQALRGLQQIKWVVFNRVRVTDAHLKSLATNESLEKIDIRRADITRQGLASLKSCSDLQFLLVSNCPRVSRADEDWIAARLTKSVKIRIK